jgi:4-hydroxy-4-methyl-2-oxoglutarate aldolase
MNNVVILEIERISPTIIKGLKTSCIASIHEVMGRIGALDSEIKPIDFGLKMAGPAITALNMVGDNLAMHRALALAKPGDVLVVNAQGVRNATWGGMVTISAKSRKIAGVVIDGNVRDIEVIKKNKFPVYARAVSVAGAVKETMGAVNIPIQCGGVVVFPGDIVVGDDDGVVVIPRKMAPDVLRMAQERDKKEKELAKKLRQGKTPYEVLGLEKLLHEKGVREIQGPFNKLFKK